MHMQVRINRKVKQKLYVMLRKRSSVSGIRRYSSAALANAPHNSSLNLELVGLSAVAILLYLLFLVSLVLQYWSVRSSKRKGLQETKQELLFHSNQDQLCSNLCVGSVLATLGGLILNPWTHQWQFQNLH